MLQCLPNRSWREMPPLLLLVCCRGFLMTSSTLEDVLCSFTLPLPLRSFTVHINVLYPCDSHIQNSMQIVKAIPTGMIKETSAWPVRNASFNIARLRAS